MPHLNTSKITQRAEVHTRVPALVVAAVLALGAQCAAVAVCYRDELQRQRRRRAVSA